MEPHRTEGRETATGMITIAMGRPTGIAMRQIGHSRLAVSHCLRLPFAVTATRRAVAALATAALHRAPQGPRPARIA
jgi:hypothetical protein